VGEKKTELRKKILEKGNGFISYPTLHSQKGYKTLKISYIRSFEKWKWIIGYGFHPDDIKPVLNKRITKLQRDQQAFIEKVTFVYFLFAFIISSTILVFSSKIKTILNSYRATIEENERKKKEQDEIIYHQSKMATIGELLNIISHQWRQPLSQINSLTLDTYLEQRHGTLNEDILKKNISDIEGITEYLSQTIDDFGNYFIQDKNKKPFLVEDAVKGCIKLLSPSLKSINLNVQIKSEKEINGFITLFQQVILTMITNSLDAFNINNTEKPKITIASYDKEEFTYITISDNAGGIKGENIKKVFDLYYSTKLKNTPSGLGLYIAKKIIENTMQGKVTVTNTSQGAEFTIKVINSGT
jgi:signal transduction histidine kinase